MRKPEFTILFLGCLAVSQAPSVAQTNPSLASLGRLGGSTASVSLNQRNLSPAVPLDDQAWQMLVEALEEAKTASPPVRAKVGLEFAKQLDQDNKKNDEAVVLKDAFLATREGPPARYSTISWIQSDILRTMMKNLGPGPVEALLPRMDEAMRGLAFDLLVTRYTDDKNWDRALDAVKQAPADNWFPFGPAAALMKALPAANVAARREIFVVTYSIYERGGNSAASLEEMIDGFWRELPREQVVELIPEIFRNAIRTDAFPLKRPTHAYERSKSKLFPILRELDPAKADQWEREELKTIEEVRKAGASWTDVREIRSRQAAAGIPTTPPAKPEASKKPSGSPKPRVVAGCLENESWCQQNRVEHALESLENHLKKNEMDLAKAGVGRGYGIALSQWKLDADPLDPNQVIKTHWPSTVNWEAFSVMATRISPEFALLRVKEIPDQEIQLLTRTMLARAWLDHPPVFPCPSLHSNYHDEGACVAYRGYMPKELFSWANNWD